jgi:hypothetical protein
MKTRAERWRLAAGVTANVARLPGKAHPQMTQMYADKTVLHLRSSAPSADKAFRQSPGHGITE